MLKFPLHSDDTYLILAPRWSDLGSVWQILLLALLFLVPLGVILWLGRYELRLVSRLHACGLLMLRLLMLLVLWLVVGLQPHLADIHIEESPSRVRIAVDLSSSMDVADVQRPATEKARLGQALRLADVDTLSRKAIIARILSADGLNLLERLQERHHVEIVGFHHQASELLPAQLFEQLSAKKSMQEALPTDLHQAFTKIITAKDQSLLGVVLFTDGQHNVGTPPYDRAYELGKQRIPIFPVLIGSPEPPNDLMILAVQAPTKVFKDATVPIEIRYRVTNMPAQDLTFELQIGGKPVREEHRKKVSHQGKEEPEPVRMQVKMDEVGTHMLSIKASSKDQKEITLANNQAARIIRVTDEKARVLLIDGEARWEYHYLANALMRDTTIHLDRVVFSQPRIGIVKDADLEKTGLPQMKLPQLKEQTNLPDPLMDYDCILLGDVSPEQLPLADRQRLERYVAERGGTLIMIAGKRYLPFAYLNPKSQDIDLLAKMLPITDAQILQPESGFTLQLTPEGKRLPFLQLKAKRKQSLELDEEEERRHPFGQVEPERQASVKAEPPKHFWGVVGKRKPAAFVLVSPRTKQAGQAGKPDVRKQEESGIVLQQNYGFGRVVFVGIDSTWRWRYRIGDTYHHQFWGQLVRWAAADKLLPAGNRLVRYGPREPVYTEGDEVELAIRVSETLPPLKDASQARAKLYRQNPDGTQELAMEVLDWSAERGLPHALKSKGVKLPAGTYRMELDIPAYREALNTPSETKEPAKGRDLFRILPREQRELLDLSTNATLLQTLANHSDGKLYTPEDVEQILDRLARRIERKESREESKPWQDEPMVWWLLGTLLGLLTLEWGWRKWLDLP